MIKKNFLKRCLSTSLGILLSAGLVLSPLASTAQTNEDTVDYTKNEHALRNVMYYGDWSIWGGQGVFYPKGMPADQITHLNFAFLDFDAQGNLKFTDKDAAIGNPVGMPGVTWGDPNAGILNAVQDLRANNPNMRLGVSIGGWSKSANFALIGSNATARANFVRNVMKFIEYTNMDFVDLDWEYPGSVREPDKVDNTNDEGTPHASPADKANYITLLNDLRAALDSQGEELGKYYELSVALPAPKSLLELGIDVPALFDVVDFANIMTYDMHGAWDSESGHQTGLYTNPNDPSAEQGLSVHDSVQYLLSEGAPANKIVIGAAFYTRGWEKVNNDGGVDGLPGLFGSAEKINRDGDQSYTYGALNEAPIKSGEGGRCGGVWSYGSLDKLHAKYPGLEEYWDDYAKAPYLYNADTGAFFTYDNVESVTEKANYVLKNGLGGVISWMASQDAETDTPGQRDELTKAIKKGLFGDAPLQKYNISDTNVDVSVNVSTYSENSTNGYEIVLTNNSTNTDSNEVLNLLGEAYKTIKAPKLYIKTESGATFSSGGYGSGTVTNANGYGIVDLATTYDNRLIEPGSSITFKLSVNGAVRLDDIVSIELSQRMYQGGAEIGKQNITFTTSGTDPVDPGENPGGGNPGGENPEPGIGTYDINKAYSGGDIVTYNGQTYRAKWWTLGNIPGTEEFGPWELVQ